jgi:hypothetical protein
MAEKEKKIVEGRIKLEGVRLSFADIWRPKSIKRQDGTSSPPKFSANALIPKDGDLTAVVGGKRMPIMVGLKKAKQEAIAKKLGAEKAKTLKIKSSAYAVKDGDEENYDGYEGNWYVSANNTKQPKLIGRDKRPLTEADGILYSGCYVNMIITLWYQPAGVKNDNPVPHAVYASLEAIQFVRDGEAFGAAGVDVDEDFEDLTDDEDDLDDDDVDDEDEEDVL